MISTFWQQETYCSQNQSLEQNFKGNLSLKQSDSSSYIIGDIQCQSQCTQPCDQQLKKKRKKKQYKKRKRQRLKKQKETIIQQIRKIIIEIYQFQSNYQSQKNKIAQLLNTSINQMQFYQIINQIIRKHIHTIRHNIWDNIQAKNWNDKIIFETHFVKLLFENFIKLKKSSPQIQKIINIFINQNKINQTTFHKNLDINTFNFLIKNDPDMKRLFFDSCQSFLIDDIGQGSYHKEKIMLNHMIQVLDDIILDQFDQQRYDENITKTVIKKKSKKNKKQKQIQEENQVNQQLIIQRLKNLEEYFEKEDNRFSCNVNEEWIQKLQQEIKKLKLQSI